MARAPSVRRSRHKVPGGEPRTRGRALGWAGNFALFQGDPATARELHAQNLAIDEEIGDHMHVAAILSDLGRDALAMGDYEAADFNPDGDAYATLDCAWVECVRSRRDYNPR